MKAGSDGMLASMLLYALIILPLFQIFLYVFLFSFVILFDLISYFMILKLKNLCLVGGEYFC